MLWLTLASLALADEGMWLPEQLPGMADTLTEMGLKLPPADLADPRSPVMASIVSLGGCSAAFVSPDGLIATNHHCVEGMLQYLSDETHDRSEDGYLAADTAGELSVGPTSRVSIVESITDVTKTMLRGIGPNTPDPARHRKLEDAEKRLVAECEAEPNRRCNVAKYYGGQTFRLVTRLELKDVRMVYAPPSSVGSYGGEIDNWEWPRHSGDFAFIRAYVAPDGSSVPFAEANIPYLPPHHLVVDTDGVQPDEFVMVAGYPGSTYRYRTARQLRFSRDIAYPDSVVDLERSIAMLHRHSADSKAAAVALSTAIFGLENVLKYQRGMLDNFANTPVVDRKAADWATLEAWVAETPKRSATFGPVLAELDAMQAETERSYAKDRAVGRLRWLDLFGVAHRSVRFASERPKPDLKREPGLQDRDVQRWTQRLERMQRSMWLPAEQELAARILADHAALPKDEQASALTEWVEAQGGAEAAIKRLFTDPPLATVEGRLALAKASLSELRESTDPWVELALAMESGYYAEKRTKDEAKAGAELRLQPLYMEALLQSRERVYPDANGTLRITIGHVKGYSPEDAALFLPQTTVAGMAAKAGPAPFHAPQVLLDAAATSPSSRFADPTLGDVPVDFTSTLDTTGGNSGSATLNAEGEFVGLLFDGNYEAMSADWLFDPELTRSIHVDVRYILWVLEQSGATRVLAELGVE